MRIAIYHNLPSGGAKRALYELSRRLANKHSIDVYTLESSNLVFGDLRPYAHQHFIHPCKLMPILLSPFGRLNPLIRLVNLVRVAKINQKIALDIETRHYDIVIVHPCQFETAPSLLRYLRNTPSVYFCQEPPRIIYEDIPQRPYDKKVASWRIWLDRLDPLSGLYFDRLKETDRKNTLSATKVLVNSRFMRNSVQAIYGFEPEVCYLGTDIELFHPNGSIKDCSLLSVGSLTPLKGFDFLVEAVSCIPKHSRPKLVIASNFQNQPERDHLIQLAKQLNVDLILHDHISDNVLVSLYNQARITVCASIREPFGLVPLESMASGTPVVSVRDGGMQESILDGETGFLVERDPKVFATVIHQLINDETQITRMGKTGRQHVISHWTWDQAVERLEKLIDFYANTQPIGEG